MVLWAPALYDSHVFWARVLHHKGLNSFLNVAAPPYPERFSLFLKLNPKMMISNLCAQKNRPGVEGKSYLMQSPGGTLGSEAGGCWQQRQALTFHLRLTAGRRLPEELQGCCALSGCLANLGEPRGHMERLLHTA